MSSGRVQLVMEVERASRLSAMLARHGQEHLLRFWSVLSEAQRRRLAEQIELIDFPLLARFLHDETPHETVAELASRAEPPPAFRRGDQRRQQLAPQARRRGEEALGAGKIGAIVVAGGQGTRLGLECPKGTFPVGPVSGRSLYQILIERILAVGRRYGVRIPLYLMTSLATHTPTIAYLEQHNYFGLHRDDVRIFRQGVMPAVCADTGRILMAAQDSLCLAPNGHGGMLEALVTSGALNDALGRGVEHFFYCQVDNPLAPCCDPELIGFHLLAGSEMTTLAVAKTAPQQRVGNIVSIDGRVRILEYTELPEEIASQRSADGSLKLWAGNTAMHVFGADFLRRAASNPDALPFHRARKATPCLDAKGKLVAPAGPNAVKFERFIFDLLPLAETAIVIEAAEADVFAPVKNASGQQSDTPETAQAAMSALYRRWIEAAGGEVIGDPPVEINPLYALDPEALAAKLPQGMRVAEALYLV